MANNKRPRYGTTVSLSRAQQGRFRPLVKAAWSRVSGAAGLDEKDARAKDAWYRRELVTSDLGIYTTKEIKTPDQFRVIMLHFANIADDQYWINRLVTEDSRRALRGLETAMLRAGLTHDYVVGIARQMKIPDKPIKDLPAAMIRKLRIALTYAEHRSAKRAK